MWVMTNHKWSGRIRHRLNQLELGYGKISIRKVCSDHQNIPSFLVLMMLSHSLWYVLLASDGDSLTSKVKIAFTEFQFPLMSWSVLSKNRMMMLFSNSVGERGQDTVCWSSYSSTLAGPMPCCRHHPCLSSSAWSVDRVLRRLQGAWREWLLSSKEHWHFETKLSILPQTTAYHNISPLDKHMM